MNYKKEIIERINKLSGSRREKGVFIIGAILYIAAVGSIYFMWRGE